MFTLSGVVWGRKLPPPRPPMAPAPVSIPAAPSTSGSSHAGGGRRRSAAAAQRDLIKGILLTLPALRAGMETCAG